MPLSEMMVQGLVSRLRTLAELVDSLPPLPKNMFAGLEMAKWEPIVLLGENLTYSNSTPKRLVPLVGSDVPVNQGLRTLNFGNGCDQS